MRNMAQSYVVRPTFLESRFSFDGPVPVHIDEEPTGSLLSDVYGIMLVYPFYTRQEIIALDVPDSFMVDTLVQARIKHRDLEVRIRGRMEDIYRIHSSSPIPQLLYQGWGGVEA